MPRFRPAGGYARGHGSSARRMSAIAPHRWTHRLRRLAALWRGVASASASQENDSLFASQPFAVAEAPSPAREDARQAAERLHELERALEQAHGAGLAKSRFLAHLGHEIRTPMSGITGMAQLLAGTALDSTQRSYLEMMQRSAGQLLGLVERLLDFARLETGPVELHAESTDLRRLLDDVVAAGWPRALERGLLLECRLDPALPRWVHADAQRLRQVLTQLLDNALEFTPVGQVLLSAWPVPGGVAIELGDTGIGIPASLQPTVFAPFVQGDDSLARRQGGIGLGLAVVDLLVRAMGGSIALASEAGRGATFTLTLPLQGIDVPPPTAVLHSGGAALPQRVAVVSDAPASSTALADRLHYLGHEVVARMSWRQVAFAPETLAAARPQVVLYDEPPSGWPPGTPALAGAGGWTCLLLQRRGAAGGPPPGVVRLRRPVDDEGLALALAPQPPVEAAAHGEHEARPRGPVLLVEDHEISQVVARSFLEHLGCEVEVAADAVQALDALARRDFALLLMDCQLPGMDGYELTRRIRAGEAGLRAQGAPIIALTAHATPEDRQRCLRAGMNDYLAKPVGPRELATAIRRWLSPARTGSGA